MYFKPNKSNVKPKLWEYASPLAGSVMMLLAGNSLYEAMLRSTLYSTLCACASDLNKQTLITLTVNNSDKTSVEKRISTCCTLYGHNVYCGDLENYIVTAHTLI